MTMRPVLAVAVLLAAAVRAEPGRAALGVTVSGGVSLGTWEAGALYLWGEAQKLKPTGEVRVVTGASAGSMNALAVALSSCRAPNPYPRRDVGWRVWEPVGFNQLFDRDRAKDDALFSRDAVEAAFEEVRRAWNEGLREGCDVVFAATVTRVKPRQIKLQEGLAVPRALETFMVRIEGRGPGQPPRVSNFGNPQSPVPLPLLPFEEDAGDARLATRNFNLLRSVIFASGAFPLAFAPQEIEYCLSKPPGLTCDRSQILIDYFLDGGVFDNHPLRVAWSIAEHENLADMHYVFFDPSTTVYPAEVDDEQTDSKHGVLSRLFSMGGEMVESARARELVALASEKADVAARVQLFRGNLPKAGEQLQHFIGFFERDFRVFDFYVGMYDAFVELRETPFDFDALMGVDVEAQQGWAPFMCLLSQVEPGYERYARLCMLPGQDNFRVLLQASLDRLYATCRAAPASAEPVRVPYHCAQARLGRAAMQVPGVKLVAEARRARGEKEPAFDYFMRLLEQYEFEFVDLGLSKLHARRGMLALRRKLDVVVEAWVAAQPALADRVLTKTAATAALNTLAFSPPERTGYLVLGTVAEGGLSVLPFRLLPQWLQVTAALGLNYVFSLLTDKKPQFAVTAVAGPEVRLSVLSNAYVQPRVAARAGVQVSVLDLAGTRACHETAVDYRTCTHALVEGLVAVTFLERLRLQAVFQTFPALYRRNDSAWFNVQFGVGFQFY
ncbi:MAG: patatin-like phospholipase family protein [Archangiaceae bacterium]|nr:patatin-like phospholipase family protein [Archangiaceae bacterium]